MEIEKIEFLKQIGVHTEMFEPEQIRKLSKFVLDDYKSLSRNVTSWSSGSNYFHLALQLKDNKWIIYHSQGRPKIFF